MKKIPKIEPLYKPQRVPKGGLSWDDRAKYWKDTPEWIRDIILKYCYGSDTDPKKCTLYYVGKKYALIKFPGGSYWSGSFGNSYCPAWIDRFEYGPEPTGMSISEKESRVIKVWNCTTNPDEHDLRESPCGRATKEVIYNLVTDLIFKEHAEGLRNDID